MADTNIERARRALLEQASGRARTQAEAGATESRRSPGIKFDYIKARKDGFSHADVEDYVRKARMSGKNMYLDVDTVKKYRTYEKGTPEHLRKKTPQQESMGFVDTMLSLPKEMVVDMYETFTSPFGEVLEQTSELTGIKGLKKFADRARFGRMSGDIGVGEVITGAAFTPEKQQEMRERKEMGLSKEGAGFTDVLNVLTMGQGKVMTSLGTKIGAKVGGTALGKQFLSGVSSKLPGAYKAATSKLGKEMANSSMLGSLFGAAQSVDDDTDLMAGVTGGALFGGAIPGGIRAVSALGGAKPLANRLGKMFPSMQKEVADQNSNILIKGAERIQKSLIKPTQSDIKGGFKVEYLTKHNIRGNLPQMLEQTNNKMSQLGKQLDELVTTSKAKVDLDKLISQTRKEFTDKTAKIQNLRENKRILKVLDDLDDELKEIFTDRNINLAEALAIKRATGTKGAWVFGSADPEAKAAEAVYNKFYLKIKNEMEKQSRGKIKDINKQFSELIPVNNALLRRIPVAERRDVIGLTDTIFAAGAVLDPTMLAGLVGKKALQSGRFAGFLQRAGKYFQD